MVVVSEGVAMLIMVLNIFIPGLGTLISSCCPSYVRREKEGANQLALFLALA